MLVPPKTRVHIRWLIARDMPEVLQIESASFREPWREDDFLTVLRSRNCFGRVAEMPGADGRLAGFVICQNRDTSILIINLAVCSHQRRQGVGSQLVAGQIRQLSADKRTRVVVEVRETNLVAQLFFRAAGFRATKVRHRYFEDTGEDAIVMAYQLPGTGKEEDD